MKAIVGMLEVSAEFAQNVSFNRERIQKALPAGHLDATTLADYLVKKASDFIFENWELRHLTPPPPHTALQISTHLWVD